MPWSLVNSCNCNFLQTCIGFPTLCVVASGRCTGGKEWQECGTACPLTCDNYNTPLACTEQCVEGCFCPEGTVLHEEECVAISDCPNSMFVACQNSYPVAAC